MHHGALYFGSLFLLFIVICGGIVYLWRADKRHKEHKRNYWQYLHQIAEMSSWMRYLQGHPQIARSCAVALGFGADGLVIIRPNSYTVLGTIPYRTIRQTAAYSHPDESTPSGGFSALFIVQRYDEAPEEGVLFTLSSLADAKLLHEICERYRKEPPLFLPRNRPPVEPFMFPMAGRVLIWLALCAGAYLVARSASHPYRESLSPTYLHEDTQSKPANDFTSERKKPVVDTAALHAAQLQRLTRVRDTLKAYAGKTLPVTFETAHEYLLLLGTWQRWLHEFEDQRHPDPAYGSTLTEYKRLLPRVLKRNYPAVRRALVEQWDNKYWENDIRVAARNRFATVRFTGEPLSSNKEIKKIIDAHWDTFVEARFKRIEYSPDGDRYSYNDKVSQLPDDAVAPE